MSSPERSGIEKAADIGGKALLIISVGAFAVGAETLAVLAGLTGAADLIALHHFDEGRKR